ncbi:MAG: type II toxin-antitoxin system VapC family toxin [Acidobacteria bacterium]|nr:type II toxin-antitoxin system VapC family toxin [Acidobacteriota bacterium]
MYIFDTDTLTHYFKGNENVSRRLENAPGNEFGITIVTKAEVLRGRIEFLLKANDGISLEKAQRFLIESENELAQIQTLTFDLISIDKFDYFRQQSKYRKIGRNDLMIASICLANRALLVTRNVKHFRQFPNPEVENWVD